MDPCLSSAATSFVVTTSDDLILDLHDFGVLIIIRLESEELALGVVPFMKLA